MPFDSKNLEQQRPFHQQPVIAQTEQPQDQLDKDPMIDYGAEYLIDVGVVLVAFTVIIIIGMFSKHLKTALLFALGLSAFLIIILWNI